MYGANFLHFSPLLDKNGDILGLVRSQMFKLGYSIIYKRLHPHGRLILMFDHQDLIMVTFTIKN